MNDFEQQIAFVDNNEVLGDIAEKISEKGGGNYRKSTMNIVSTVSYLIGVDSNQFGKQYLEPVYAELENNELAKTIRNLCILRNSLLRTNLEKKPNYDYIATNILDYLSNQGINPIESNSSAVKSLINVNSLINIHISNCQTLFPMWVKWEYIKKLFKMPTSTKEKYISKETCVTNVANNYKRNRNCYPYQCYIQWPIDDPNAYQMGNNQIDESAPGNVLLNDEKFLTLLYHINEDTFNEINRVLDVSPEVKTNLKNFITSHERIDIIVDCENSDPYKFCSVMRSLKEYCGADYKKINKIILYDDVHTVDTWNFLDKFLDIFVEHIVINRINEHKSLVDISVAVGVCKEHYQNQIDGFLLATSDSDYWALISALPEAGFFMLVEKSKFGDAMETTLNNHSVSYCMIDQFVGVGEVSDIKEAAVKESMMEYMKEECHFNIFSMLKEIYQRMKVDMTESEEENFYNKYVKNTLELKINDNGDVEIVSK